MNIIYDILVNGFLQLSFWGYVIAALILTQITIVSVTIYLHRCQSHRALTLHPIASHFFRFYLWLTTGMVTKEWVAIHRKHHAATDVEGDPHSPLVEGLSRVLFNGTELYRKAAKDQNMVNKYSFGTPDDWLERNVYSRFSAAGIFLMLFIDLFLFGLPGISIWGIQMLWIPFWGAGVINGIGHFWGYRNFECKEAATNIVPWAFWIGGEELHNNHHAFASSAKFSVKWWEFDIGWVYISILSALRLAKVKKLPPKFSRKREGIMQIDIETVKAVISTRLHVMSDYYKNVVRPLLKQERKSIAATSNKKLFWRAGNLLRRQENLLSPKAKDRLYQLLENCEKLKVAYKYRQSLQNIWLKTAKTQKELIEALQKWCQEAEASGLEVLHKFAQNLKGYTLLKS